MGCWDATNANGFYIEFNQPAAFNAWRMNYITGGSFNGVSPAAGAPTLNTWYAIGGTCVTSGGNVTPTIWVNGTKTVGSANPAAFPSGLTVTNINVFGHSPSGFSGQTVGICAMWNVVLTDLEMIALANGASPFDIRPGNLAGFWDPQNQATVPDQSGNGVNLTLSGTPLAAIGAPTTPWIRPPVYLVTNQTITATDFSVSGGSSVVRSGTTANINVTPNGTVGTANCIITPTGPAGWTFTPTTQTINVGSGSTVTFTATAPSGATIGSNTLTFTQSGGSSITGGPHTLNITVLTSAVSFTTGASPTSIATGGTSTITYTLDNPAPHGGVVLTPTLSGPPGGSTTPPTVSIPELSTVGTTTYTAGGSSGTEVIGASSVPSLTQTSSASISVSSSPLAAGTLSMGTIVQGAIPFTSTAPTGGVPPYVMQLYRSEINLPASSLNVADLGANAVVPGVAVTPAVWGASQSVTDRTVAPSKTYYYQAAYTDTSGLTVLSNQLNGTTLNLVIGFIGDSITHDDHTTIPTGTIGNATGASLGGSTGQCVRFLQNIVSSGTVTQNNQGVPGASTLDWVIGQGSNYYPAAKTSFQGSGVNVIHIMLGTNDATTNNSGPQTPANVKARLATLISQIKGDFPGVPIFLSAPSWLNGVRGNAAGLTGYGAATLNNLRGYVAGYYSLIDNITVFPGDFNSLTVYNSTNEGSTTANGLMFDGVHMNDAGAQLQGTLWGYAIARVIFPRSFNAAGRVQVGSS